MSQLTSAQLTSKEGRMALVVNLYNLGYFTSKRGVADIYDMPELIL